MNFGFTEEQELLRAEVRKYLDQNAPLEEVRKQVETAEGFSRDLWSQMGELGWLGLASPEAYGGAGMDLVTLVVLLEETGRSLFPSPLVSSLLAAKAIERSGPSEQQSEVLAAIAAGSCVATFALLEESDRLDPEGIALRGKRDGDVTLLSGTKTFVPDAGQADVFVVAFRTGSAPDDVALALIRPGDEGVTVGEYPGMDLTKRTGRLVLDDVRVPKEQLLGQPGSAAAVIRWLVDAGALLVTAEMCGAAEQAVALTSEFAKERIQFDHPIGRYQGVKHPLAEMYVDVESFKSLLYYAAWALDRDAADASLAVSRAKAYASDAFARIGIDGVQLHGGVGYTWEYDIQLYLKRSKWARSAFGDADYHYDRIASLGGL